MPPGPQYTLDQVITDPSQKVVVAVLTAHNTSHSEQHFGNLSVTSLLSDTAGRTHSPDPNSSAVESQCEAGWLLHTRGTGRDRAGM